MTCHLQNTLSRGVLQHVSSFDSATANSKMFPLQATARERLEMNKKQMQEDAALEQARKDDEKAREREERR